MATQKVMPSLRTGDFGKEFTRRKLPETIESLSLRHHSSLLSAALMV